MTTALGRKSSFANADVDHVWRTIRDRITPEDARRAVDAAAAEVEQVIDGQVDNVVYGWSGGKDSQALRIVMDQVGIRRCVLGIVGNLEFQGFLTWVAANAPTDLEVFDNTDLDLSWLADHDRYLFPRNSTDGYFWTMAGTRRAQRLYQQRHDPDFQIYGRRRLDNNQVGKDGIARSKGITSYSPLRDWSHEMVLAVIHYADMPLPPGYSGPHGWTAGTGPWPGRRVGTVDESWAETYAIEPDRVREAAEHIPSARAWLAARGPQ